MGVLLLAAGLCAQPAQAAGKRVLFLLGDVAAKDKYSIFIGSLESLGFSVDVKAIKDSSLKLKEYDTWLYDHLAIFAPKADGAQCAVIASRQTRSWLGPKGLLRSGVEG